MIQGDWTFFREGLLDWYKPQRRPMPWKGLRDPYLIWLSEIILQQTRVEQGWPYFERFQTAYPTVADLAAATEDEVLRLWQGLGYYSRGRNLLKAAKLIVGSFDGKFPKTYSDILRLPGVGPYTGAAIASFAYDLPVPVVDGNVYRVLARYTDESLEIDSTAGKKKFAVYAEAAMAGAPPALYNQAIMDFGALVCKPKRPACATCPLAENCRALHAGTVAERPVKRPKKARQERHFYYFLIRRGDTLLFERRGEGDIWAGLYQLPLLALPQVGDPEKALASWAYPSLAWLAELELKWGRRYPPRAQMLTHQKIVGHFQELHIDGPFQVPNAYLWADQQKIEKLAFPKLIADFFREKTLSLDLF